MKTIAFYLPQFHPIPENDQWWGRGFTEWTNVARAKPRFKGHYQPHIPADLGFYDLRLEETRIAQAELAKKYGIHGFCYYHYWFNGKMLLERPLQEVVASGKPDFPFCVCWANENWTRRWDGLEQEILIKQNYENYDAKQHFNWLSPIFADQRYIKIKDKPLFIIYRPGEIKNIEQKVMEWKEQAKQNGFPGLYLVCTKNFKNDREESHFINIGFNAFIDFQPQLCSAEAYNAYGAFLYNYREYIQKKGLPNKSEFVTFPCVFPSWDNSARRKEGAHIIQNNNPALYKRWLMQSLQKVREYNMSEQIVFINAWNEWAEGCHLEPDLRNKHAFLKATKEALDEFALLEQGKMDNKFLKDTDLNISLEQRQWRVLLREVAMVRPLYIWGTGASGVKTMEILQEYGIKVTGFFDNNASKWDGILGKLPVLSPLLLKENQQVEQKQRPYIIISSMYGLDIKKQLSHEYNLDEYIDFILDYGVPLKKADLKKINEDDKNPFNFCNACGNDVPLYTSPKSLSGVCSRCGSSNKERTIIAVIEKEFKDQKNPCLELLSINLHLNLGYLKIFINSYKYLYYPHYIQDLVQNSRADILELPYKDESFDIIVVNDYSNKPMIGYQGYREIYRTLKKDGVALVVFEDNKNQPSCIKEQMPEMGNVLRTCGFSVDYRFGSNSCDVNESNSLFLCKRTDNKDCCL
jgi:hypothetical protein